MFTRLIIIIVYLIGYSPLLKAQFFQATLTNDNGDLVVSLIPTCGDIGSIGLTQIEFFIESSSTSSAFTYDPVVFNSAAFPGAPTPMVEPPGAENVSGGGAPVTTRFSALVGTNSSNGGPYLDGVTYELLRIPLSGGTGTADFRLIIDANFVTSTFVLFTEDINDDPGGANYAVCLGDITNSATGCDASCMAMVDHFFTGDDVQGSLGEGFFSEGVSGVDLPAELLTFTAKLDQQSALLKWESAQELNFKGYEVERSMDGKNFEPIAWIDGEANTLEQQQYIYTDKTIATGETYYYRLRMVDLDLTFDHSPIVVLTTKGGKTEYVHISPNPAKDWINLELNINDGSTTKIELRDLSGKLIYTEIRELNEGLNGVQVDSSKFPAGIYILGVHTEQAIFTERLIIQ